MIWNMTRNWKRYIMAILLPLVGGCAERGTTTTTVADHGAAIETALQRLLSYKGPGGFVIVEEAASGRFVQFAGSASEGIEIDLPAVTLSTEEYDRATELFAALGVPPGPEGFRMELKPDAEHAARLAVRVLREVFEVAESAELNVTYDR
jgi:hypothetical protein